MFATGIILLLVPVAYFILEDVKALAARFFGGREEPAAKTPDAAVQEA